MRAVGYFDGSSMRTGAIRTCTTHPWQNSDAYTMDYKTTAHFIVVFRENFNRQHTIIALGYPLIVSMPCKRPELWIRENFSQDLAFKSGIGSDFQIWIKESASHILCIAKMIALKSLKLNNISYKIKVLKILPLCRSSLFFPLLDAVSNGLLHL